LILGGKENDSENRQSEIDYTQRESQHLNKGKARNNKRRQYGIRNLKRNLASTQKIEDENRHSDDISENILGGKENEQRYNFNSTGSGNRVSDERSGRQVYREQSSKRNKQKGANKSILYSASEEFDRAALYYESGEYLEGPDFSDQQEIAEIRTQNYIKQSEYRELITNINDIAKVLVLNQGGPHCLHGIMHITDFKLRA
jgi:hypothetical protein